MWGQYAVDAIPVIVGNPTFNYFFTLVTFWALIGAVVGSIIKIITRS